MKLSLLSIDKGGFVSVGAEGTITAADFHVDQKNPFEVVLGPAWPTHRVIFDMKQVNFMDSSAIGWLIDSNKSFHGGGRPARHPFDSTQGQAGHRPAAPEQSLRHRRQRRHRPNPHERREQMSEKVKTQLIDVTQLGVEESVDALIAHALAIGASDLFLVSNEQHIAVQARALGIVRPVAIIPLDQGRRIMSTIKARSSMDLSEKRRPLDGRWIYTGDGATVDLRISSIPTMHGEDFAIRMLDRNTRLLALENLGLMGDQYNNLTQMIESPGGLVLICGPTGSGKTATLYACLSRLNDGSQKINTIEDPIEFDISGLRQSQINTAIGLNFSELLRSVLRQSPDVVMIGEIRDAETAQTAVHAANSGQLVFATIHAPIAAAAVQSMRSLGVHSHFLASALRGVVSQRLVRTLCTKCKTSFDLSDAPYTFDEVRPWLGPTEGKVLYAARGCDALRPDGLRRPHRGLRAPDHHPLSAESDRRRPAHARTPRQGDGRKYAGVPPGRAAEGRPGRHQHRGGLPRHPRRASDGRRLSETRFGPSSCPKPADQVRGLHCLSVSLGAMRRTIAFNLLL